MYIDRNWSFTEALRFITEEYPPYGYVNPRLRNNGIHAWGQLVGRTRALAEFDLAIKSYGSLTALGKSFSITPSTLKKLRDDYLRLPDEQFEVTKPKKSAFYGKNLVLNHPVTVEENRTYEFKDVCRSRRPIEAIKNTSDEYVVAFLNSEGGSILWGIRDIDRVVTGIRLDHRERDDVRKVVTAKLNEIRPSIDPTAYHINFHQVYALDGSAVMDYFVIEIVVPAVSASDPYFTCSDELFVRVDGAKRKLSGPALTDWIKRRLTQDRA